MLNRTDVVALVTDELIPRFTAERQRLDWIALWCDWRQSDVTPTAATATPELRRLIELARTPWLTKVVTNVAQCMRVDGYRTPESHDESPGWRLFVGNDMDHRQDQVHRAMLNFGIAYVVVLPGADPLTGEAMARFDCVSPRSMLAFYTDPAQDEWAAYALRSTGPGTWRLYDEEAVHDLGTVTAGDGTARLAYTGAQVHAAGVCPVVRFTNLLDLDGRSCGEVEPLIPLAQRINKTTWDRLLIQHFNSWKVRWVTGMSEPDTQEDANRKKLQLRHDDLLIGEDPDTKFGTLPETPLDGVIRAYETDIKTLAAVSQTPVHALTGDLINLSAEALAAARAEADAKVGERQRSAGVSWNRTLRLGAHIDGDTDGARDFMAGVTWADFSVRSIAQAADAYGKFVSMLGVPAEGLWPMIPGVTRNVVDEWKALKADGDTFGQLAGLLERQAEPVTP